MKFLVDECTRPVVVQWLIEQVKGDRRINFAS